MRLPIMIVGPLGLLAVMVGMADRLFKTPVLLPATESLALGTGKCMVFGEYLSFSKIV